MTVDEQLVARIGKAAVGSSASSNVLRNMQVEFIGCS
jgi:hypothetical protein